MKSEDEETPGGGDSDEVKALKEKIRSLEQHVTQLRNVINKRDNSEISDSKTFKNIKKREFNVNNYKKRHVLFRIAYFGWDYNGYTVQEDTAKTIEFQLFKALELTRLIADRQSSNYHRCGRTDKGVSAFHQVISIDVRTNLKSGTGVFKQDGCLVPDDSDSDPETKEVEYCKILNSNLPAYIQVLAWAPCADLDFSARFNCKRRSYKYFFPKSNLNLEAINEAGSKLKGAHDFRNFCKMDVNNGVLEYVRRIESVSAEIIDDRDRPVNPYSMCVLNVVGNAFLWHQIRCIIAVLFRVGHELESPDVIDELLDVQNNPRRPQYSMSSEIPLNLFDCQYDDVEWNYEPEALNYSVKQFRKLWTEEQIKATMIKQALSELEAIPVFQENENNLYESLVPNKGKTYIPLMKMLKCPSLEEKIATMAKRKKFNPPE